MWGGLALGAFLALAGLFSGQLPLQLLGGLTGVLTAAFGLSTWRQRRQTDDVPLASPSWGIPELGLGERLLPYVFLLAAVVLVVFFTVYTGSHLGWW